MPWKSSTKARDLPQHPSCAKPKPLPREASTWGMYDLTSCRRRTTLLSCTPASSSSTQKWKGPFQQQAEKSPHQLPLQELKIWIHLNGSQKQLVLKYEHHSGKDPARQTNWRNRWISLVTKQPIAEKSQN